MAIELSDIEIRKRLHAVQVQARARALSTDAHSRLKMQALALIADRLGEDSYVFRQLKEQAYPGHNSPADAGPRGIAAFIAIQNAGRELANAIEVAIQAIPDSPPPASLIELASEAYDPELWEYVRRAYEAELWRTVGLESCSFYEHALRVWTGRLLEKEKGSKIATDAFRWPDGVLRIGSTGEENSAWKGFSNGIFGALRNVFDHRIEGKHSEKIHGVGVLGAVSLIITEIRRSNPDLSPVF